MAFDQDNNYYFDPVTDSVDSPYFKDPGPSTYNSIPTSSGVYYDAFGNEYATQQQASNADAATAKAAGAVGQNNWGDWVDKFGKVVQAAAPLLNSIASPYLDNLASGGLLKDAKNMLMEGGSRIANIKMPDLMALIPKLQLQVQQGIMSPAQASAAMASLQGQMTPEQYTAVQAVMQGKMTPAEAIANEQAASGMKDVVSDQSTLAGARNALGQLSDIAENRGMTEADRAAFASFMNEQASRTASDRAAQIQQMQMQGNAGTGTELAARLAGVQGGANVNAAAGANMAQAAQARALAAIQGGIQGNTALNAQLFGQDASKAQAQDLVNQFNAQAKNAVSLANAGFQQQSDLANFQTANQMALANQAATNNAGQFNAGARQSSNLANFNMANQIAMQNAQNQQAANIANAGFGQQSNLANFQMANDINKGNTGILNTQAMLPLRTADQQFQNNLAQQTAAAKAQQESGKWLGYMGTEQLKRSNNSSGAIGQQTLPSVGGAVSSTPSSSGGGKTDYSKIGAGLGSVVGSIWPGIGTALGGAAGSLLGSLFSDEDLKKDKHELSDDDVDSMMGAMTGYKYRYRGDKNNPEQTGVMAQDMEEGMPSSVVNTPAGKMIQKPEALSKVLAVLANNNERIRKLEGR